MRHLIAFLCVALLTACMGNGDTTPRVTDIQVQSLSYGQKATFLFLGTYLDLGLSADVPNCGGQTPVFTSPTQQALSCVITATGNLPVQVRNSAGDVVFSKNFTVPSPRVTMLTSMGNIVVELDHTAAPLSVDNFLQYVGSGYYNNTIIHRVIAGFVIQGGGYTTGVAFKPGVRAPIALESNNGLTNLRGTLAMARTAEPNSATSQFYFNLVNNASLDYSATSPGYAVFGKIVQGLDIVDSIGAVPTATQNGFSDVPVTDVLVKVALRTQ